MSKMELSWFAVSDLDKAVEFYTKVVGLELTRKNDEFGWAELRGSDGGAALGLGVVPDDSFKPGSNAIVTLTVEDIEVAKKEIGGKGAQMLGDTQEVPGMCWLQMFADKDGNIMQLFQPMNAGATHV